MAVAELFTNQGSTTVSSGGTTAPAQGTTETWTVASSGSFPAASTGSAQFHVADPASSVTAAEIIAVTNVSGTTWTVTRGAESTTPVTHTAGFTVQNLITSGTLGNFPQKQAGVTWGAYEAPAVSALVDGASIAVNAALGNVFTVTLGGSRAMANPTGPVDGQHLIFMITQDGTGSRALTWGTAFDFGAGGAPALSQAPGATDMLGFVYSAAASKWRYAGSGGSAASKAWQFSVDSYGAKGDVKVITDATIAGGALSTLTSATAAFTSVDTGKHLVLASAAAQHFTITFVNSTTVTLNTAASGAATGIGAVYGTDDTTAVQSCINAAVTYAQAGGGFAEVVFSAKMYGIAGAPAKTSTQQNNAQLYLPIISGSSPKVTLKLTGTEAVPNPHWLETGPPTGGSVLVCLRVDGAFDNTYLWPSVLGGPVNGYGGVLGTFSNMFVVVNGLTALVHYQPSFGGLDLYGCAQADVRSWACVCMAQVPSGGPWPQYVAGGPSTGDFTYGYRSPTIGNNAVNNAERLLTFGQPLGVVLSDHFTGASVTVLDCQHGVALVGSQGTGRCHLVTIQNLCAEGNSDVLFGNSSAGQLQIGGPVPVAIGLAAELNNGGIVNDSGNLIFGDVWWEDPSNPVNTNSGASETTVGIGTGGTNVRLFYLFNQQGVVPSANTPAVPLTTVAHQNKFWQNAYVIITSGGAAVTVIAVNTIATGLTLGASGSVTVPVPTGATITLTYASTAPTWKWVLT